MSGPPDLKIGDRVEEHGKIGTIRFIGTTDFMEGNWVGVELDEGGGKNDGSVKGKRYFECEAGYGVFVRPTACRILDPPKEEAAPAPAVAPLAPLDANAPPFIPAPGSDWKKQLAQAAEDHDVEELGRLLEIGDENGADLLDLDPAMRVLYSDLQRNMYSELDEITKGVSNLFGTDVAESKAAAAKLDTSKISTFLEKNLATDLCTWKACLGATIKCKCGSVSMVSSAAAPRTCLESCSSDDYQICAWAASKGGPALPERLTTRRKALTAMHMEARLTVTGKDKLQFNRLSKDSKSLNCIASCCNTLMFIDHPSFAGNTILTFPEVLGAGSLPGWERMLPVCRGWFMDWGSDELAKLSKLPSWHITSTDPLKVEGGGLREFSDLNVKTATPVRTDATGETVADLLSAAGGLGQVQVLGLSDVKGR